MSAATAPPPGADPAAARPADPGGFLLAILRSRPWLAVATVVVGTLWLVPGAVIPLVVGAAVDAGVAHGDTRALTRGVALVVALGLAQMASGGALDFLAHGMWLHAASATQRTVNGHVLRLGASLTPQAAGGDVTVVTTSDLNKIGNLFETAGRLAGSVVAFGVVGAGLVARSPLLGAVALVGVPLAVAGIGPLIAPLQRHMDDRRGALTAVNALAADIVSGLRILRGIGEARFAARAAESTARGGGAAPGAGGAGARRGPWARPDDASGRAGPSPRGGPVRLPGGPSRPARGRPDNAAWRAARGGRRVGGGEVDAGPARRRDRGPDVGRGAPRRARRPRSTTTRCAARCCC